MKSIARYEAKATALENAAEFIRGHGEEGGLHEDSFDFPLDMYLAEAKVIAKSLEAQAHKVRLKIEKLNDTHTNKAT